MPTFEDLLAQLAKGGGDDEAAVAAAPQDKEEAENPKRQRRDTIVRIPKSHLQAERARAVPRVLVICPAGPTSLHDQLCKSWGGFADLCLIWYGEESAMPVHASARCVLARKGPKWQLVRYALNVACSDWARKYEFVWLPDDDLKWQEHTDEEDEPLVRLVRTARLLNLALCQPSLADLNITSPAYRAVLTRGQDNKCLAHRTNFVEIMCPLFSTVALQRVLGTFDHDACRSGWGLDQVWPAVLGRASRVGVVDTCTIIHTRPPNSFKAGAKYQGNETIDPRFEEFSLMRRYSVNTFAKRVLELYVLEE
jgi:hypothetical protein